MLPRALPAIAKSSRRTDTVARIEPHLLKSTPVALPTIFDLCTPRADVLAGNSSNSDFAADLARVIRGSSGPSEYSDPSASFPTRTRPAVSRGS